MIIIKRLLRIFIVLLSASFFNLCYAQEELAKQSQNPLGTIISLPFENNFYFGVGPSNSNAYALNFKPVYPVTFGHWNMINRFIVPAIYSTGQNFDPPPGGGIDLGYAEITEMFRGSKFGLGDSTYQAFFSPVKPGKWTLGAGPAFVLPTATSERYASDKWSAGFAAVALTMPGKWVVGGLIQNVWSFAGNKDAAKVNKFLAQYFINYNIANGWYLSTTPVMTADWEADTNQRWTIPLGGGVGRLVKHGNQAVDYKIAAYKNVEKPQFSPDWNLQLTVKFLFPK